MTSVANTTSTTGTSATTAASKAASEQTDKFLKILLTELQNQNPLDPVKPTEYTSQLAAYSSLEQQIKMNTKLDSLVSTTSVSPVAYLGTTVDYDSPTAPVQDNQASWTYSTSGATTVKLSAYDSTGALVYSATGDATKGDHVLTLAAGSSVADGVPLTLKITALDSSGAIIGTGTVIKAKATVDSIETANP